MRLSKGLFFFLGIVGFVAIGCSSTPSGEDVGTTDEAIIGGTFPINLPPAPTGTIGAGCFASYAANPSWGPHCASHAGCNQATDICEACGQPGQACCDGPRTCASGTCFSTVNPNDPTDNVMCIWSSCDAATHRCGSICGNNAGDDCCPPDAANAWPICRGDHLTCQYSSNTNNGVPVGGKCIPCGAANQPSCQGSCYDPWSNYNASTNRCDECGYQGEDICKAFAGNGCHSDRLNPDPKTGKCMPCGFFGGPACQFGAACYPPFVRSMDSKGHTICGQCGLCGHEACGIGGANPPTCANGMSPYDDGADGIRCWGAVDRWCGKSPPPECSQGGRCGVPENGSSSPGGTNSTGATAKCQCTPDSGNTAAGIALCGQPTGGPCLPQAPLNMSDKSLLCAPTLGCVPDMTGNNYTCQPPSALDHWQCQTAGALDSCWTSAQAGLCEGNPGISGGNGGNGGSGGSGGSGNSGGGGGCVGGGCGNNGGGGGPTGCCQPPSDGTSTARIVMSCNPCNGPCCEDQPSDPDCIVCYGNAGFCPKTGGGSGICNRDLSTTCTFQCSGQMGYTKKIPKGAQKAGFECKFPSQSVRPIDTCPDYG